MESLSNGNKCCATEGLLTIPKVLYCVLLLWIGSAQASAAESGFYAGVEIGQSDFDSDKQDVSEPNLFRTIIGRTWLDTSSSAWSAKVGYQWNRFIAFEMRYSDMGTARFVETQAQTSFILSPTRWTQDLIFADASLKGAGLGVIGSLPWRSWELSAKASMFFAQLSLTGPSSLTVVDTAPSFSMSTSSGWYAESTRTKELMYGVALNYAWSDRYKADLGWSATKHVGEQAHLGGIDVSAITLGFRYYF